MASAQGKSGVYLYPYALNLFRERRITLRGALLLGFVDHNINPWKNRRLPQQMGITPEEWEFVDEPEHTHVQATTSGLMWLMQCDRMTVLNTVKRLKKITPQAIKIMKPSKGIWQLKTRVREDTSPGGLYIPPGVLDLWLNAGCFRHRGGIILLLLARTCSFQRNGNQHFETNKSLGKFLGVHPVTVSALIKDAVEHEWMYTEYSSRHGKTIRHLRVSDDLCKMRFDPDAMTVDNYQEIDV